MSNEFYTLKGYQIIEKTKITDAMEDYLEMIYRISIKEKEIHLTEISESLNVKKPSVSKMMTRLKENNFITYEKYKEIKLTETGKKYGKYLYQRHQTLVKFFKLVNKEEYSLKQVEKIEHFIDDTTILNLQKLIDKI